MPKPQEWKGSDLRARGEVVSWLRAHGGEVHDPTGLMVGRMRSDLGKGRALSQLLADMEHDGMIKREVRGRRTLMLKLIDDWGLATVTPEPRPSPLDDGADVEQIPGNVDLEQLANTLLALVLKRAQVAPSRGAEVEKLKEQVAGLKVERQELRDALILARESEAEQRRQADSMRESLAKLQRSMDKPKRGGVPLKDHLSGADQRLLKQLMESLPSGK